MKSRVTMVDPKGSGSTIITNIEQPKIKKYDHNGNLYVDYAASVKISDCSRWIEWTMTTDTYDDKKGGYNLRKLRNAIDILCALEKDMIKAQLHYKELASKVELHNKKCKAAKKEKQNE